MVRATVNAVISEEEEKIVGTDATQLVQMLSITFLDGQRAGETTTFENDLVMLEAGDLFYLHRQVTINGDELLLFKDVDRRMELLLLALLFVALMLWFARLQGARALLSLGLSVAAILFVLIPALLAGYNPVLVSLAIAGVILAIVLFGTHGFKPHVIIAFAGTWSAVLATGALAAFWVGAMNLSGFGDDASVYLNFATDGRLDFAGLLLGAIIIGILGVLDDVSITQASVAQQLKAANASFGPRELYNRTIVVGRDHVASLVNTLALAYVGVALPLVLFLSTSEAPIGQLLNQEIVAAELTRIIIGSIGVVLAVPLTTAVAAWWFGTHEVDEPSVASCGHHHH